MSDNYTAKEADGTTRTFRATDSGSVLTPQHHVASVPADPFGTTADAAVTAGATGSISAKLRSISRDLVANIVLAAGTNLIGIVTPYAARANAVSGTTASVTDTTSTQVIAGVSSNYLRIGQVTVQNSHASVDTWVLLQDGSGGTTLYSIFAPHGGGGAALTFPMGLLVPTVATGLFFACVTTGTATRVSAAGYKEL